MELRGGGGEITRQNLDQNFDHVSPIHIDLIYRYQVFPISNNENRRERDIHTRETYSQIFQDFYNFRSGSRNTSCEYIKDDSVVYRRMIEGLTGPSKRSRKS